MARPSRWTTEEAVAERLNVAVEDVGDLIEAGELAALEFPNGTRRIDLASVKRFERDFNRRGFAALPAATHPVSEWTLPSGRTVHVFIGAPRLGVRHLHVYYDDTKPLSEKDSAALQARVLPDAAERIQKLTGKNGWAWFPTPPTGAKGST
jgi:hypothetical protein